MKVILKRDLDHLGMAGEIVTVKDGYARNYLIPRGLVLEASTRNVRQLAHQKRIAESHRKKVEAEAHTQKKNLDGLFVTTERVAGEDGKIHGSVTSRDIADLLSSRGVEVDRRRIIISDPIRRTGEYLVDVKLDQGVRANIKVIVQGIEPEPVVQDEDDFEDEY